MSVVKRIVLKDKTNYKGFGFYAAVLFSALTALLPFLYQYGTPIPVLSLGEALLLPFLVGYFVSDLRRGIRKGDYCGFYVLMSLVLVCNFLALLIQPFCLPSKALTVTMRLFYYALFIYVGYSRIRVEVVLPVLVGGAAVNSMYTIGQYISHMFLGFDLPTALPFLSVFSGEDLDGRTNLLEHYRYYFRPSGLFLEPSYAAFFSAPGLLLLLLHERYRHKFGSILLAVVITLGLIVGTSSMAVIAMVIGWGGYAATRFVSRNDRGQYVFNPVGLFVAIFLCCSIVAILLSPLGEMTLSRLNVSRGSAGQRVIRGWLIASQMDIKTFLIGTGLNNVAEFVSHASIATPFDEVNLDYLSSWSSALVSSGVFVFVGYVLFMIRLYKRQSTFVGKALVLLFVATGFVEATLYTYRFAFYALIALMMIRGINTKKM